MVPRGLFVERSKRQNEKGRERRVAVRRKDLATSRSRAKLAFLERIAKWFSARPYLSTLLQPAGILPSTLERSSHPI
jgi:hypothetical protein